MSAVLGLAAGVMPWVRFRWGKQARYERSCTACLPGTTCLASGAPLNYVVATTTHT